MPGSATATQSAERRRPAPRTNRGGRPVRLALILAAALLLLAPPPSPAQPNAGSLTTTLVPGRPDGAALAVFAPGYTGMPVRVVAPEGWFVRSVAPNPSVERPLDELAQSPDAIHIANVTTEVAAPEYDPARRDPLPPPSIALGTISGTAVLDSVPIDEMPGPTAGPPTLAERLTNWIAREGAPTADGRLAPINRVSMVGWGESNRVAAVRYDSPLAGPTLIVLADPIGAAGDLESADPRRLIRLTVRSSGWEGWTQGGSRLRFTARSEPFAAPIHWLALPLDGTGVPLPTPLADDEPRWRPLGSEAGERIRNATTMRGDSHVVRRTRRGHRIIAQITPMPLALDARDAIATRETSIAPPEGRLWQRVAGETRYHPAATDGGPPIVHALRRYVSRDPEAAPRHVLYAWDPVGRRLLSIWTDDPTATAGLQAILGAPDAIAWSTPLQPPTVTRIVGVQLADIRDGRFAAVFVDEAGRPVPFAGSPVRVTARFAGTGTEASWHVERSADLLPRGHVAEAISDFVRNRTPAGGGTLELTVRPIQPAAPPSAAEWRDRWPIPPPRGP